MYIIHLLLPSVKSFIELANILLMTPDALSFLSQCITQDPLEKLFGLQRQRGRVNENPNIQEFEKNSQALRVIQASTSSSSIEGNCRGNTDVEPTEHKPLQYYRPISLLSNVSKVLERLIYGRISDFIRSRISQYQFGFMMNRSPVHKLLTSLNIIVSSMNNRHCADVIFLDFKKAFDSVGHNELIYKLKALGLSDHLCK